MFANEDCGLFIGIDDYSAYDLSMDKPAGTSNLPGSLNDARAFWRVARWLGMRPENLRILTSPALDPAELDGATAANVGEATEAGILGGARWLASVLHGRPERAGLMTYSGHGAYLDDEGLVLCPSDTQGANLQHAIAYSTLGELLGPAGENLTTVLDCCHSGQAAGTDGRRVPSIGTQPVPSSMTDQALAFAGRVLAACGPQQITQQGMLLGKWDGSFTWALASALEQWKSVPDGVGRRIDVTYGELIDRAAILMKTLEFQGMPLVTGPSNVRGLSVMQRGHTALQTSLQADAARARVQLDPGGGTYRWYTIRDNNNVLYANVLVPAQSGQIGGTGTSYQVGTEYWYNVVSSLQTGTTSLTFTWTDYTSYTSPGPTGMGSLICTMSQDPRPSGSYGPPNQSQTFVSNSNGVALSWGLNPPGKGGSVSWYTLNTTYAISNTVFGNVSSGQRLTGSTSAITAPKGTMWVAAYVVPTYY